MRGIAHISILIALIPERSRWLPDKLNGASSFGRSTAVELVTGPRGSMFVDRVPAAHACWRDPMCSRVHTVRRRQAGGGPDVTRSTDRTV